MADNPVNPWQAIALGPARFLRSAWPWRSLAYLAGGCLPATVALSLLQSLLAPYGPLTALLGALAGTLGLCALAATPLAAVERLRLRLVDTDPVRSPHAPAGRRGLREWLRLRMGEPATWREVGYAFALAVPLPLLGWLVLTLTVVIVTLVAVPVAVFGFDAPIYVTLGTYQIRDPVAIWLLAGLGLALLPPHAYLVSVAAAAQATLARTLLAPREEELNARVRELTRSRTRLVDAFEAQQRRIERDLHDGAQQRLVSLTMTLGMASLELHGTTGEGPRLVERARHEAEQTLAQLRELVHGIHPRVLTDRGLQAAVTELADRAPLPVTVDIELPRRPAPAVETGAYFVISEALANASKHSQAGGVTVWARKCGAALVLVVRDDGDGGADPDRGTGLQGLADRVAVMDGTVVLTSPHGGPTELRAEIPWTPPTASS